METPLPQRKRLAHATPAWVKSGAVFFITINCAELRTNSLAHENTFRVLQEALQYYVTCGKLWVHLVLAMPDHLHALLATPSDQRIDKLIRDWKRFTAKQAGIVWQNGFFDHRLRHDESFEAKAHYIRMNPVRAGLVYSPADWPYIWDGRAGYP